MKKIAILGFGTVGSGVAEILFDDATDLKKYLSLKYILDIRDFPESPWENLIVHDFSIIEQDPEIEIVVETIGGSKVAYDFTKRALLSGKSVVTSNKELVSKYGPELFEIAKEHGVSYLFEASVGGGIPLIRTITDHLKYGQISRVYGILNGTTNYILTRMTNEKIAFEQALEEAKSLGYAEADPTDDIEGIDSARKISILASLVTGREVPVSSIETKGIHAISAEDMQIIAETGFKLKLLGRIEYLAPGRICAFVEPHLIEKPSPLYDVEDVYNGIVISGKDSDNIMLYGKGAGKLPTASAIVADLMHIEKYGPGHDPVLWTKEENQTIESDSMLSRWYIRYRGLGDSFGTHTILKVANGSTALVTAPISKIELRGLLKIMPLDTVVIRVL